MTPEAAQVFFSLLVFVSIGLAVAALLPWLVRSWRGPVWGSLVPLRLPIAAAVASTCMLGSLYFSEVANYAPCTLCWYQRIAMYPLVLILGIAAARGDAFVRRYVAPIAAVGALISIYHIGVERLPGLPTGSCSVAAPCDLIWVERFGFVTIPVMALAGFVAILTLLLVYTGGPQPERESNA